MKKQLAELLPADRDQELAKDVVTKLADERLTVAIFGNQNTRIASNVN